MVLLLFKLSVCLQLIQLFDKLFAESNAKLYLYFKKKIEKVKNNAGKSEVLKNYTQKLKAKS